MVALAAPSAARADVTGSYSGQIVGAKKGAQPVAAAAVFSTTGSAIAGTIALGGSPAAYAGAYLVSGKATPKKIKVTGSSATGATIAWRGKIVGTGLQGKVKVRASGSKLVGTLTLSLSVSSGDGSACDGVYQQNATLFTGQVLGQALVACTACHVPGGQAAATRFHDLADDPLATARSVALLVDDADPSASLILEKPLDLVPHGGGQQILPGTMEEQIVMQWVDLIAQSGCAANP
jgi:hypothetical protein